MTVILQSAVITIELQSLLDSIASIPGYENNENYVNQVEQLNKQIENLYNSFFVFKGSYRLQSSISNNKKVVMVSHN